MDDIDLWRLRPRGPDPRAHLWFHGPDRTLKRICDGAGWRENPENESPLGSEPMCGACTDMFTQDRLHGREALGVRSSRRIVTRRAYGYGGYPSYNGGTPRSKPMPTIPMHTFAKFCAARKSAQLKKIVHDCWEQDRNPQYIFWRDYYGPLRRAIEKYHLQTGDLAAFDSVIPRLPEHYKLADRKAAIQMVGRAYSDYCRKQDFEPFRVQRAEVELADVSVRVNPELGIRTDVADEYVVKMWFNAPEISRQVREIFSFLMHRAQDLGTWSPAFLLAVWDVRRHRLLPSINPDPDLEPVYITKARMFAEIWETLET